MRESSPFYSDPQDFLRDRWQEKNQMEKEEVTEVSFSDLYQSADSLKAESDRDLLNSLIDDLANSAKRYDQMRDLSGRGSNDSSETARRSAHNALLSNLEILVRNFDRLGLDTSWTEQFGDPEDHSYREKVGDWAVNKVAEITKH